MYAIIKKVGTSDMYDAWEFVLADAREMRNLKCPKHLIKQVEQQPSDLGQQPELPLMFTTLAQAHAYFTTTVQERATREVDNGEKSVTYALIEIDPFKCAVGTIRATRTVSVEIMPLDSSFDVVTPVEPNQEHTDD